MRPTPHPHHDPAYERPITARYLDPVEIVWLATARRLGLTVRRHPDVFAMTEGDGVLHLGPRESLDPDDSLVQMIFHEVCHWITNGTPSAQERDWGFGIDAELDPREHACQRLQACLAQSYGLRDMLGATGDFRQYWDRLPEDPMEPLDESEWEKKVVALAQAALERSRAAPFAAPLQKALAATSAIRENVAPFLSDYMSEDPEDALPSLWATSPTRT